MTIINPNNSGTIKIGITADPTDQFECQVTDWAETPDANTSTVAGSFCAAPTTAVGLSSWWLEFSYHQDWGATPSLSELLDANDGETLYYTFTPANSAVPESEGNFQAMAGPYGGPAGEAWTGTGRMPLNAKPVRTAQV